MLTQDLTRNGTAIVTLARPYCRRSGHAQRLWLVRGQCARSAVRRVFQAVIGFARDDAEPGGLEYGHRIRQQS